jgi:hypothetical protein
VDDDVRGLLDWIAHLDPDQEIDLRELISRARRLLGLNSPGDD